MKLSEVLHYYIGQKTLYSSHHEPQNESYTLTLANIEDAIKFGDRIYLRRLEDMTEQEMKDIWLIVFGRPFYERGVIKFHEENSRTPVKRWVLTAEVDRLGILWDGRIWADSDLSLVYFNQHIVTHYLLSKGFDLFNLIDNGEAIDAKTIKTE